MKENTSQSVIYMNHLKCDRLERSECTWWALTNELKSMRRDMTDTAFTEILYFLLPVFLYFGVKHAKHFSSRSVWYYISYEQEIPETPGFLLEKPNSAPWKNESWRILQENLKLRCNRTKAKFKTKKTFNDENLLRKSKTSLISTSMSAHAHHTTHKLSITSLQKILPVKR